MPRGGTGQGTPGALSAPWVALELARWKGYMDRLLAAQRRGKSGVRLGPRVVRTFADVSSSEEAPMLRGGLHPRLRVPFSSYSLLHSLPKKPSLPAEGLPCRCSPFRSVLVRGPERLIYAFSVFPFFRRVSSCGTPEVTWGGRRWPCGVAGVGLSVSQSWPSSGTRLPVGEKAGGGTATRAWGRACGATGFSQSSTMRLGLVCRERSWGRDGS